MGVARDKDGELAGPSAPLEKRSLAGWPPLRTREKASRERRGGVEAAVAAALALAVAGGHARRAFGTGEGERPVDVDRAIRDGSLGEDVLLAVFDHLVIREG